MATDPICKSCGNPKSNLQHRVAVSGFHPFDDGLHRSAHSEKPMWRIKEVVLNTREFHKAIKDGWEPFCILRLEPHGKMVYLKKLVS